MEVISECFVKPKHEVEASKENIYLSPVEILLLGIYPIQKGLLYPLHQRTSSTIVNLLDNLKHSLSIALLHFYPLSGRFATETFPEEHACSVFIDYNKGLGAKLAHIVALDLTVSDILSPIHVPTIVRNFFDLGEEYLDYDGHTRPLLSIQVTQLVDGVFIGFTMNHSVVDGISFMNFLRMLSEIFDSNNSTSERSLEISRVPIIEHRPLIKLPYLGLDKVMIRRETGPLRDRVFHFSSKSMAMIKAKANQEGSISNVSSFQGLVSLIWRSITRARNLSTDEETNFSMGINARTRVDPPLSDDYFGNYIAQVKVNCKVGELLSHDLGWAAKLLNEAIKAQDDISIRNGLKLIAGLVTTAGFLSTEADLLGPNSVIIGGSARFDLYGLEFGLGKAIAVLMGPGNKSDGKVNASQGCEGGGSVDLEISLKSEHMAALEADNEFMTFVS